MVAILSIAAVPTGAANLVAAPYSIFEAPRSGGSDWDVRAELGVAVLLGLREIALVPWRAA